MTDRAIEAAAFYMILQVDNIPIYLVNIDFMITCHVVRFVCVNIRMRAVSTNRVAKTTPAKVRALV